MPFDSAFTAGLTPMSPDQVPDPFSSTTPGQVGLPGALSPMSQPTAGTTRSLGGLYDYLQTSAGNDSVGQLSTSGGYTSTPSAPGGTLTYSSPLQQQTTPGNGNVYIPPSGPASQTQTPSANNPGLGQQPWESAGGYSQTFNPGGTVTVNGPGGYSMTGAPPVNPAVNNMPANNPFGIADSGLQAFNPGAGVGTRYWATDQAAQSVAAKLGGQAFQQGFPGDTTGTAPQWFVRLPNGNSINIGGLLGVYENPNFNGNPGILNAEVAKYLNGSDITYPYDNGLHGAYNVGADGIKYDASAAAPGNRNAANGPNAPPITSQAGGLGMMQQRPASQGQNFTVQQQPRTSIDPGAQYGGNGMNGLAQLAAFFNLFGGGGVANMLGGGGGGNFLSMLGGYAPQQQSLDPGILTLLMMLSGAGSQQPQPLYSRSQYPRFP